MTDAPADARLFTIGHSNHPLEAFLALLRVHRITAVGDVRSSPYSRFNPQYNRELLAASLRQAGLAYVFLGDDLGARRAEPECYEGGKARYERVAQLPRFRAGLDRVRRGTEAFRVALMCAEKDPLVCHRGVLICRHLREHGPVYHIREDGSLEPHADAETRLLALCDLPAQDLFRSRAELVEEAYTIQGERIAYTESAEEQAG